MTTAAIIDCDPGHDDVMAILLAARTLDLRGITTVHGNASLANTTQNARKTVEFAGLTHIPIAAGMTLCDGRRLDPATFRSSATAAPPIEGKGINETAAGPNAEVAVDAERFWSLFLDVLATYP